MLLDDATPPTAQSAGDVTAAVLDCKNKRIKHIMNYLFE